jgi:thiosulfate/3-mercaptopyruvate sulfurtransferase
VLKSSKDRETQILDARTAGRFAGTEMDRYPGTRPGHIPNSVNLYWADLLEPDTRKLLPPDVIRERIAKAGITLERPVTLTCGSGLTACILALGLHLTGRDDWRVYDGSWDEWGRRSDLPVESAK